MLYVCAWMACVVTMKIKYLLSETKVQIPLYFVLYYYTIVFIPTPYHYLVAIPA